MLKGTRLERTACFPQAWHDVKTQILKMLEEIRPPTKYQWKLSSTQTGMERKKKHAESMLRQSVSFRSNKGGEVEQSRQIHKEILKFKSVHKKYTCRYYWDLFPLLFTLNEKNIYTYLFSSFCFCISTNLHH